MFGSISPDGRFVYYLLDAGGSEIGHWVRVPFGGGAAVDMTPSLEPYSSFDLEFGARSAVAAFSGGTDDCIVLYRLELGDEMGPPTALHRTRNLAICGGVSADGSVMLNFAQRVLRERAALGPQQTEELEPAAR